MSTSQATVKDQIESQAQDQTQAQIKTKAQAQTKTQMQFILTPPQPIQKDNAEAYAKTTAAVSHTDRDNSGALSLATSMAPSASAFLGKIPQNTILAFASSGQANFYVRQEFPNLKFTIPIKRTKEDIQKIIDCVMSSYFLRHPGVVKLIQKLTLRQEIRVEFLEKEKMIGKYSQWQSRFNTITIDLDFLSLSKPILGDFLSLLVSELCIADQPMLDGTQIKQYQDADSYALAMEQALHQANNQAAHLLERGRKFFAWPAGSFLCQKSDFDLKACKKEIPPGCYPTSSHYEYYVARFLDFSVETLRTTISDEHKKFGRLEQNVNSDPSQQCVEDLMDHGRNMAAYYDKLISQKKRLLDLQYKKIRSKHALNSRLGDLQKNFGTVMKALENDYHCSTTKKYCQEILKKASSNPNFIPKLVEESTKQLQAIHASHQLAQKMLINELMKEANAIRGSIQGMILQANNVISMQAEKAKKQKQQEDGCLGCFGGSSSKDSPRLPTGQVYMNEKELQEKSRARLLFMPPGSQHAELGPSTLEGSPEHSGTKPPKPIMFLKKAEGNSKDSQDKPKDNNPKKPSAGSSNNECCCVIL